MAAELKKDPQTDVETVKGKFLELSVFIDGKKAFETNPLLYPMPGTILKKIRQFSETGNGV